MNRRIWTRAHFVRFQSERVKVDLLDAPSEARVWLGEIGEVGESDFELRLENGDTRRIRFDEIEVAKLRLDPWKRKPKDR
ncbi:MAG: hypothetical protein R3E97_10270 [Candidatus Eisenbacteria bacterium]